MGFPGRFQNSKPVGIFCRLVFHRVRTERNISQGSSRFQRHLHRTKHSPILHVGTSSGTRSSVSAIRLFPVLSYLGCCKKQPQKKSVIFNELQGLEKVKPRASLGIEDLGNSLFLVLDGDIVDSQIFVSEIINA